jgi:hypothetical protein
MHHVDEFIKAEREFRARQEQAIQDQLQRDRSPSIASWTVGIVIGLGVSGYVLYWLWQFFSSLFGIAGEQ